MMRKKNKHEEHENHERWLVSYADFITLLFAFFVVMYATSSANEEKQKEFEESVKKQFNLAVSVGGAGGPGHGAGGIGDMFSQIGSPIEGFPKGNNQEDIKDYVEKEMNKLLTEDEKKSKIVTYRHDSIGVRISLAAESFFNPGSMKLKHQSLESLNKVAAILKRTDKKVIIEGHTDNQPVAEASFFESNWELASLRATTVVRYFNKIHGIDGKRMAAVSYGDQKPIAPNDSEENRSKNRRIEILIAMDPDKTF